MRERKRSVRVQAGPEGGGTSAHRPGQGAARMEIRPDRFKAVAGKTLGKIHRYTTNIPGATSDFKYVLETVFALRDTALRPTALPHPLSPNHLLLWGESLFFGDVN